MLRPNVYFVLPKASSYNAQTVEQQLDLKSRILMRMQAVEELGLRICCFAEDSLALELLSQNESVLWETVVTDADKMYLMERSEQYAAAVTKAKRRIDEKSLKSIIAEFPYPRALLRSKEASEEKDSILVKRIRSECQWVLTKKADTMIFFRAGESYCSIPKWQKGDGKRALIEEGGSVYCFYSGLPVNEEMFMQILRAEVGCR